jgi:metallophosphoesterase (TIGR03767 family)
MVASGLLRAAFTLAKVRTVAHVTRRSVLLTGAGGLALLAFGAASPARATDRVLALGEARAHSIAGTTLEQSAHPVGPSGYRRLAAGPGFPLVAREELASAGIRRDQIREALASIVQITDLHIMDAQSPMRFEYLIDIDPIAFRPHEAMGTQAAAQLVARINQLASGPFTGRAFDCVVSTGDNTDNNETIELEWFLKVMNGGAITPSTGDPTTWEGVQSSGRHAYYNPELGVHDHYKQAGFPQIDRYFSRVTRTHRSTGLKTPWYSVFGNHDDSISGILPARYTALDELYTGSVKFTGFESHKANLEMIAAFESGTAVPLDFNARPSRRWEVTPDERRAPFTPAEFMAAHLAEDAEGAGPIGHGFDAASASAGKAYYSFQIAPGVTGIALDSTNRAGFVRGSIGTAQLRWLDATLKAGTSNYFDAAGNAVRHIVNDTYFVLFSHHTTRTMNNAEPDPAVPHERRHLGPEIVELVQRYPTVLAWVNGHTHSNAITPHPGPRPEQSFWEINTASHIEFPQQARILDLCDNRDGTLSLFTTLIESAAPYQASYSDDSQSALGSVYREFSFNDPNYVAAHNGSALDRNTELLLANPLF